MYSVYDTVAAVYMQPFFAANDGMAARTIQDTAAAGDSMLTRHSSAFVLFRVGEFDDATANLVPETPVNVGLVENLLKIEASPFEEISNG